MHPQAGSSEHSLSTSGSRSKHRAMRRHTSREEAERRAFKGGDRAEEHKSLDEGRHESDLQAKRVVRQEERAESIRSI
ncbi:hypothetical protein Tco_0140129 [Tanacetum coccineum]